MKHVSGLTYQIQKYQILFFWFFKINTFFRYFKNIFLIYVLVDTSYLFLFFAFLVFLNNNYFLIILNVFF